MESPPKSAMQADLKLALKMAVIVGGILIAINHYDALLTGEFGDGRLLKMALTPLVPFCVALYSARSARRP